MKLRFLSLCVLGVVVGLSTFTFVGCQQSQERLIVIHTGRLRGNVYPLGSEGVVPLQYYSYIAGYVKQVREEAARTGAQVVLIDSGDSLNGSFVSEVTGAANMVDFFHALNYDAIILGNLDSKVSMSTLESLRMPVLTPFAGPDGKPAYPGTHFGVSLDKNGLRVVILANFYGEVSPEEFPERFPTRFGPHRSGVFPVRDYTEEMARLTRDRAADVVLFNWMKFESPEQPPVGFLEMLKGLGVDAIVAHRVYSSRQKDTSTPKNYDQWGIPVSENLLRQNRGFAVGRIDLVRGRDGKWKAAAVKTVQMTANTAPRDSAIEEVIARHLEVFQAANVRLGELNASWDEKQILMLYLESLTSHAAEVVGYSRDSIRSTWASGVLTAGAVYEAVPWRSGLVRLEVTPAQWRKLRETMSLDWWIREGSEALGVWRVVTSEFFGRLILQELGADQATLEEVDPRSEFELFVDFLKARGLSAEPTVREGWSHVPGKD